MALHVYSSKSNKTREIISKRLKEILKERYKIYKQDKDNGKIPVCGSPWEAQMFAIKYHSAKLGASLSKKPDEL